MPNLDTTLRKLFVCVEKIYGYQNITQCPKYSTIHTIGNESHSFVDSTKIKNK